MRTFLAVFVLTVSSLHAQAIRYDWISSTTNSSCASGVLCPILAIPGTTVSVCTGTPSTLAACLGAPATTYTNAGAGTPCATTSQLTPATGGACRSTSDNQGNYGWWILPGSYSYFLRVPSSAGGGSYGPYPINLGASAGCPLGATCDANYATLALACAGAGSGTLFITRNWNGTPGQNLCNANFLSGVISMASSAALNVTGKITALPTQKIFDVSASGSSVSFAPGAVAEDWVTWFGADQTGVAESAAAIQAAIDACFVWGGSQFSQVCFTGLPVGDFKVSTTIRGYGPVAHQKAYNGFRLAGSDTFNTRLLWYGASNATPLVSIGNFTSISNLQIINQNASGWRSCYDYNGDAAIGLSTVSHLDHIYCEGSNYHGDGITMGRSSYESDSLVITASKIDNFPEGTCITQIGANTQGLEFQGGDITNCAIGWIGAGNTNQAHFSGTNFVLNDLDFFGGPAGSSLLVDNVRSERSKRTFFSQAATAYNPTTWNNFFLSTNNTVRLATTTTASPGAQDIVLSVHSFTLGDRISIAGAGAASAALITEITNITDTTHVHIADAIVTGVTNAAVTLSGQQYTFVERSSGPHVHSGGYIQTTSGGEILLASLGAAFGTQSITGVGWAENITNPGNVTDQTTVCPTSVSWTALWGNGDATPAKMQNYIPAVPSPSTADLALAPSTIYLNAGAGSANNAIVATPNMWCTPVTYNGMTILLSLGAYTLQAGANTLNLGGGGVTAIHKFSNPSSNLGTGHIANSFVQLLVANGLFLDMSQ